MVKNSYAVASSNELSAGTETNLVNIIELVFYDSRSFNINCMVHFLINFLNTIQVLIIKILPIIILVDWLILVKHFFS